MHTYNITYPSMLNHCVSSITRFLALYMNPIIYVMDNEAKKRFDTSMAAFEESVRKADMPMDIANCFLQSIDIIKDIHKDTEAAHMRIDHRKDEQKLMKKSLDSLSEKIAVMSDKVSELTKSQNGLIKLFNSNIEIQNRQLEEQRKHSKRLTLYIIAISLVSLIGTFGSIKGATIASSIWNVISKII